LATAGVSAAAEDEDDDGIRCPNCGVKFEEMELDMLEMSERPVVCSTMQVGNVVYHKRCIYAERALKRTAKKRDLQLDRSGKNHTNREALKLMAKERPKLYKHKIMQCVVSGRRGADDREVIYRTLDEVVHYSKTFRRTKRTLLNKRKWLRRCKLEESMGIASAEEDWVSAKNMYYSEIENGELVVAWPESTQIIEDKERF